MGNPALRYELHIFNGKRNGLTLQNGYSACIYDSAQNPSTSGCPTTPAVGNPKFKIEESSAGTLDLTLLNDGESTIHHVTAPWPSGWGSVQTLRNFIFLKQTEVVLVRKILRNGGSYETKELWSGRVTTIRKDFYNNWSIYSEGELSYLNDFTMDAKEYTEAIATNASQLFKEVINDFNSKIASLGHHTITNGQMIFPELDRTFTIRIVDVGGLAPEATNSALEKKFSISSGQTYWQVLEQLRDRFGGHFEIVKENGKRYIDWRKSGSDANIYDGYHAATNTQYVMFGRNLLDYAEEQDGSGFFTVLKPYGAASKKKQTGEDGETEVEVNGPPIDISTVNRDHPGSPYIYDNSLVAKYGFIEKTESWNVSDPSILYALARAYYKDLRIGSKKITIKAYDLKNLLSDSHSDASILNMNSLFLYDCIYISNGSDSGALDPYFITGMDNRMPITSITIPLDKFNTDTEYVISNSRSRRNSLAPGKATQKQIEEVTSTVSNMDDSKPEIETEAISYIEPVYGDLGVDTHTVACPLIYLDRDVQYFSAETTENSYEVEYYISAPTTYYWYGGGTIYHRDYFDQTPGSDNGFVCEGKGNYSYFGYKSTPDSMIFHPVSNYNAVSTNPGNVFYTDDVTNTLAYMRYRNSKEQWSNKYEKVDNEGNPRCDDELTPYISANSKFFNSLPDGANITLDQPWSSYQASDSKIKAPKIIFEPPYGDEFKYGGNDGITPARLIEMINAMSWSAAGVTVGDMLSEIGVQLTIGTVESFESLLLRYEYKDSSNVSYFCYSRLIRLRDDNDPRYMRLGYRAIGDTYIPYLDIRETPTPSSAGGSGHSDEYWHFKEMEIDGLFYQLGALPGVTELEIPPKVTHYSSHTVTVDGEEITYYLMENPTMDGSEGIHRSIIYQKCLDLDVFKVGDDLHDYPNTVKTSLEEWFALKGWFRGHRAGEDWHYYSPTYGSPDCFYNQLARLLAKKQSFREAYGDPELPEKLAKAKAQITAQEIFILVKTKENGVENPEDSYGVISWCIGDHGAALHLRNENVKLYTESSATSKQFLSSSESGLAGGLVMDYHPLLITKDVLKDATEFLFKVENSRLAITNSQPLPMDPYSWSPMHLFMKCGGCQTKHVANTLLMRICGDTFSSHINVTNCVSKLPPFQEGPGSRYVSSMSELSDGTKKIWYEGPDMKKRSDYPEYTKISDVDMETLFRNTAHCQPVIIGSDLCLRLGADMFAIVSSYTDEGWSPAIPEDMIDNGEE